MQDIEFSVYGFLFQAGRNGWGTAGMGGNGQFNRLCALDDVADGRGPWRDRLTEDQDLGLRLIVAGWRGRQELRAVVDQQGLLEPAAPVSPAHSLVAGKPPGDGADGRDLARAFPLSPRLELIAYLLMPFWQAIVGRDPGGRHRPRGRPARRVLGHRPVVAAPLLLHARVRRNDAGLHRARRAGRGRAGWSPDSSSPTCTRSTPGCCGRSSCARRLRQLDRAPRLDQDRARAGGLSARHDTPRCVVSGRWRQSNSGAWSSASARSRRSTGSTSRCPRASASACSAPTAPASRRRCGC